eukprot:6320485-Amphidinium_carterae.1
MATSLATCRPHKNQKGSQWPDGFDTIEGLVRKVQDKPRSVSLQYERGSIARPLDVLIVSHED